jgi:hypothetical protein
MIEFEQPKKLHTEPPDPFADRFLVTLPLFGPSALSQACCCCCCCCCPLCASTNPLSPDCSTDPLGRIPLLLHLSSSPPPPAWIPSRLWVFANVHTPLRLADAAAMFLLSSVGRGISWLPRSDDPTGLQKQTAGDSFSKLTRTQISTATPSENSSSPSPSLTLHGKD